MRIRASILTLTKIAALAMGTAAVGCGGSATGKILADTPALPYQAPDVDEISGTESSDDEAKPQAAPAPQPVQK